MEADANSCSQNHSNSNLLTTALPKLPPAFMKAEEMEADANSCSQNHSNSNVLTAALPKLPTALMSYHDAMDSQPDFEGLVPLMQMNGRKVLGPPENWVGPPPSNACELYVRRIPKNLSEQSLIEPFLRFGRIYEIRVPIEYNNCMRGFAYVKYTKEEDAACAIEVLNHYFVTPGRKLEIVYSYEKCRLFISNVPRELTEEEVEHKFRYVFPSLTRICFRSGNPRSSNIEINNRGHVFVHFATHLEALAAKKSVTPGIIRLWGRDLKVVWADSERENSASPSTKTLFVRHVDLTINTRDLVDLLVKYVPRSTIRKVSKVRTSAFIDFITREAAEVCLRQLQGIILRGQRLELEWARPSEQQSLHRMRNIDFDAMLRLKCMANGWSIPVIIFGTYFNTAAVQYATVMLRDNKGIVRAIYCVLQPPDLADIHSRLCEVVCALIETIGTFPDYNYMFLVEKENAHLLGMVTHGAITVEFIAAHGVPHYFNFDLNEVVDLSCAVATLSGIGEETLIGAYHESFRINSYTTYLPNLIVFGHRIFGTIMPKYRNKPPLNYNLNDTQIVLALCYLSTGSNLAIPSRPFVPFSVANFDNGSQLLKYVKLKLLPLAISQSRWETYHCIDQIVYGDNKFYHPAQRVIVPPIWITGYSYATSIKQLRQQDQQSLLPILQSNSPFLQTNNLHQENRSYFLPQSSAATTTTAFYPFVSTANMANGQTCQRI